MPDALGKIVPDVGAKLGEVRKPWVLQLKRWSLSMRVSVYYYTNNNNNT